MSTGPGPTRKADGSSDASVSDIADLLVDDGTPTGNIAKIETSDDSLDVMLETPGPVLASAFMPPPPTPVGEVGDDGDSTDEGGAATNLAYEDLLAKLVLPAKAPEPEPQMPAVVGNLPLPEPLAEPLTPPSPFGRPSVQSLQIAPPADERTLVTENPLVAEEQEAAYREGRTGAREQPVVVREELRPAPVPEPVMGAVAVNGAAKSRLVYLMLGGLLMLTGMIVATLVLKLLMPSPAPQPVPVVVPAAPPPPASAPAHVEPLPPSAPPAAVVPTPPPPTGVAPSGDMASDSASEPKSHRGGHARSPRPAAPRVVAPKPAPAPKVVAPKPAPAPTPKPPKAALTKKGKGSAYADPFDN